MALTQAGLTARQSTGTATFLYLAVGTGVQAGAAADQTALHTELVRVAISSVSVVGGLATLSALLTNSQGNGTLTELGIYTASSGGTLLTYQLITPAIIKTADLGRILRIAQTLANA